MYIPYMCITDRIKFMTCLDRFIAFLTRYMLQRMKIPVLNIIYLLKVAPMPMIWGNDVALGTCEEKGTKKERRLEST